MRKRSGQYVGSNPNSGVGLRKQGVYHANDVYDGREQLNNPGVGRYDEVENEWENLDNFDPYWDRVRVAIGGAQFDDDLLRDKSGNYWEEFFCTNTYSREFLPSYFGPAYTDWSTVFLTDGYHNVTEAITGTISSTATSSTITGLVSTTGMVVGMPLTKISGTGAFGGTTTIANIISSTSIGITSTTTNTTGSITFNFNYGFTLDSNNFTIEFWMMKFKNDGGENHILSIGSSTASTGGGTGWTIFVNTTNNITFYCGNPAVTVTGTTALLTDTWYHIVLERTSTATNGFRIYLNGAVEATGTLGAVAAHAGTYLRIGRDRAATAATSFGGQLCDFRFVNGSAVYNGTFSPPTSALNMNIANVVYHDSVLNRRHYLDYDNHVGRRTEHAGVNWQVKKVDSPYLNRSIRPVGHGYHSLYNWLQTGYIRVQDSQASSTSLRFGTGAFTVEAWVYRPGINAGMTIISKGVVNGNVWRFEIDTTNRLVWTDGATAIFRNNTNANGNYISGGGWVHVAAVREGTGCNQFKLYVNGKLDHTATLATNYTSTDDLRLFSRHDGSNIQYGYICGLRVSTVARYTSNFSTETNAFCATSMSTDANVSLLVGTVGNATVTTNSTQWVDYGYEMIHWWRYSNEHRLGQTHITSPQGHGWSAEGSGARMILGVNARRSTFQLVDNNTYTQIACGDYYTLAIRSNGTLWAWGDNRYGQLGLGDRSPRYVPTQVGSDTNWSRVGASKFSSYAVKTTGTLWAWGENGYGQLGQNNTTQTYITPTQVGVLTTWVEPKGFWYQSSILVRNTSNELYGIGYNGQYNFGNGGTGTSYVLTIGGGSINDWTWFSTGQYHAMGVRSGGTLWGWAGGYNGRLGTGNNSMQGSPIQIGVDTDWSKVVCGNDSTIALKTTGTIWFTGYGAQGAGGNLNYTEWNTFQRIGTDTDWSDIFTIRNHLYFAEKTDGTLYTWGQGYAGTNGTGLNNLLKKPTLVPGISNVAQISGGIVHTMALTNSGQLYSCGHNKMGMLGNVSLNTGGTFDFGTGDFSIEFWFMFRRAPYIGPTGWTGVASILDSRSYYMDSEAFAIRGGYQFEGIDFFCNGTVIVQSRSQVVRQQTYIHYCVQRTNGNIAMYANGIKVDEASFTGNIRAVGDHIQLMSGTPPHMWSQLQWGIISDLRIEKGRGAYVVNNRNPDSISIPTEPLQSTANTVLLTCNSPIFRDLGPLNLDMVWQAGFIDQYTSSYDLFVTSMGPYRGRSYDFNCLPVNDNGVTRPATSNIPIFGVNINATFADPGGLTLNNDSTYHEFAFMTRYVKPWTLEGFLTGHAWNTYDRNYQHRIYTGSSPGHNGFTLFVGLDEADPTQTTIHANNNNWNTVKFTVYLQHNSSTYTPLVANTQEHWKIHSFNHVAVVFNPAATNKWALFINGRRAAANTTIGTASIRNYYTQRLNFNSGCGGLRISDVARYNTDATTYTVPTSYPWDSNTVSVPTCIGPFMNAAQGPVSVTYGTFPSYKYPVLGRPSLKMPNNSVDGSVFADRIGFSYESTFKIDSLAAWVNDFTVEFWCAWWDSAAGGTRISDATNASCIFFYNTELRLHRTNGGFYAMSQHAFAGTEYHKIITTVPVAGVSSGTFDFVVMQRTGGHYQLWINGVPVCKLQAFYTGVGTIANYQVGPNWDLVGRLLDYAPNISNGNFYIGYDQDSYPGANRRFSGYVSDVRFTHMARYETKTVGGVATMVYKNSMIPAVPKTLFPRK